MSDAGEAKLIRALAKLKRLTAFRRKEYDRLRAANIMTEAAHAKACTEADELVALVRWFFERGAVFRIFDAELKKVRRANAGLTGEELAALVAREFGVQGIDVPPNYTLQTVEPDPTDETTIEAD